MLSLGLFQRLSRVIQKNVGFGCVLEKLEQLLCPGFNIGRVTCHGRASWLSRQTGALKVSLKVGDREQTQRMKALCVAVPMKSNISRDAPEYQDKLLVPLSPSVGCVQITFLIEFMRQWNMQALIFCIRKLAYKKELPPPWDMFKLQLGPSLVEQYSLTLISLPFHLPRMVVSNSLLFFKHPT